MLNVTIIKLPDVCVWLNHTDPSGDRWLPRPPGFARAPQTRPWALLSSPRFLLSRNNNSAKLRHGSVDYCPREVSERHGQQCDNTANPAAKLLLRDERQRRHVTRSTNTTLNQGATSYSCRKEIFTKFQLTCPGWLSDGRVLPASAS